MAKGTSTFRVEIPCVEGFRRCADRLREAGKTVHEDIEAVRERDPAATSDIEVALLYSGFHALEAHRVAHILHKKGFRFTARAVSQAAKFLTGIEIHPGAEIGHGFFIDHGAGVVIGETARIGDNCTLYQGVTLGGTGKDTGKRHPTLGNNVMVGCGAKILGPFTIGDNSKIAAGAVVLEEIPRDSTAVGIPARVVRSGGRKVNADLDQINIPDPVANQMQQMEERIALLEKTIEGMRELESIAAALPRETADAADAADTAKAADASVASDTAEATDTAEDALEDPEILRILEETERTLTQS